MSSNNNPNVFFSPQDLTTSGIRLFQIAVPINRYDEIIHNIFKFLSRTGRQATDVDYLGEEDLIDELKMLTDIHWISLSPEDEEIDRLRVKNARLAVDFTDKLLIRDPISGEWKGTLYYDENDPDLSQSPIVSFDPLYWRPELNYGKYYGNSVYRGVLLVFQENTTAFIHIGILTVPQFRCWAFEVLAYITYGNYIYTDICDEFDVNWVIEDLNVSFED